MNVIEQALYAQEVGGFRHYEHKRVSAYIDSRSGRISDGFQSVSEVLRGPEVLTGRRGQSSPLLGPGIDDESIMRDTRCAFVPNEVFVRIELDYHEAAAVSVVLCVRGGGGRDRWRASVG